MNKLEFYYSLLKYSISNPKSGIQLLKSTCQVLQDRKNKPNKDSHIKAKVKAEEVIDQLFPDYSSEVKEYRNNISLSYSQIEKFFENLKSEEYPSKKKPYPLVYQIDDESGFLLYAMCKLLKPNIVVETGVAYGLSSTFILQALKENNNGTLYSIDSVFRPWQSENTIGSLIPIDLRNRWKFINGLSNHELKPLLNSLGNIDIFLHDSLHTFKNMKYEFETAWPFIKKGGFLLSDDILANNAFHDFHTSMNVEPIILQQKSSVKSYMGILQKP